MQSSHANTARGQGFLDYYNLHPQQQPVADTLLTILSKLKNVHTDAGRLVKANLHLELSRQHDIGPQDKKDHTRLTLELLTGQRRGGKLLNFIDAAPLLAHSALITNGNTDIARKITKRNIVGLLNDYERTSSLKDSSCHGKEKGQAYELITMLALGHTGLKGITANPSLERHDRNNVLVDNQYYTWDVTTRANGRTIAAGEYRLQIKAQGKGLNRYHPDIVKVSGREAMSIETSEIGQLFELGRAVAVASQSARMPAEVVRLRENLLDLMVSTGPVAPY